MFASIRRLRLVVTGLKPRHNTRPQHIARPFTRHTARGTRQRVRAPLGDVSSSVKKRFPTMDHLVTAGIMTETELKEFDSLPSPHIKYWKPMQWAFIVLTQARDDGIM